MINQNKSLFYFLFFILLSACGQSEKATSTDKGKKIAKVNQAILYESDLEGIVQAGTPKKDSAQTIEMYIDSWIKKQLMMEEAKNSVNIDESEIDQKVQEYKYNLIAYELEKKYVKENLVSEVSEEEIKTYYENNQANFELKNNIIKGIFIIVPQNAPQQDTLKKLLQTNKTGNNKELKEYCLKFAMSSSLNDTVWVEFEKLVRNTPFSEVPNKTDFVQSNALSTRSDAEFNYYLKISDFKISNQISPLQFVRERVIGMIINQRKVQLIKKLEQEIYEKAKNNNAYTIYKDE